VRTAPTYIVAQDVGTVNKNFLKYFYGKAYASGITFEPM